jgi:O-antigen/teichoic acid export membrane protein
MLQDGPSLGRNFIWTLGGNLIYAGCQWGMLVSLAKLGTPQMVGQFALALAITAPVFQLASLQLRTLQATDARQEYRFSEYLSLRLASTAAALAVMIAVPFVAGYRGMVMAVIFAVALVKAIESFSDLVYGLLQQHERMQQIARSMILKGSFSLAALSAAVYLTKNVAVSALCVAGAWLLVLFGYDFRCGVRLVARKQFRPAWNRGRLGKLFWVSLPMGLVLMLLSLNVNIPRYFIERLLGDRQLGIFAAMAYLIQAGGMLMNALGSILSPRLARYYAEGQSGAFRALLLKLLGFGAAAGIASILTAHYFGRLLLTLFYRAEYAQYASVLTLLMVAGAVSYMSGALGVAVSSLRCFAGQFPVNLFSSLAGLLCSYLAISRHGLYGAALAVLAIALASLAGNGLLLITRLWPPVKLATVAQQPSAG